MRIGLIYDTFDAYPWRDGEPPDADAEYEPVETVDTLAAAVEHLGHEPVRIGTAFDLREALGGLDLDAAINIAEGAHSRNREAYAPILLEMADVPCLGSDALTLSMTLDKSWTKDLVAAADVPTPPHRVYRRPEDVEPDDLPGSFPLFAKPRYEGSSKGLRPSSRVETLDALRAEVERLATTYEQDVLVEAFVEGGGEFTVAVVGHDPPEALPVLQRGVEPTTGLGLHALEHRGAATAERDWDYDLPGTLDAALEDRLQTLTLRLFDRLECRDFARADFRVDAEGRPWFLEVNPLPTFAPGDTFAIIAELMGRDYVDFLAEVFEQGLRRLDLA